jgi:CDP-diacylglycerol--glycerol-3-phosphate 3-phosphatidyltransferase
LVKGSLLSLLPGTAAALHMNLPNKLTVARLFIAFVIFALLFLANDGHGAVLGHEWTLGKVLLVDVALVLFVVAALTDTLDGYLARRGKLFTDFGRVADPLIDKIVVGGVLVFLSGMSALEGMVAPWMIVLILTREFLVTGFRGMAESKGSNLLSSLLGKAKMVVQCVTISAILLYLGHFRGETWAYGAAASLLWLTVALTAWSGALYVPKILAMLRAEREL